MAHARTLGVSGTHTAAIGIMEHLALRCPQHEFVVGRSSIEGVSEIASNLTYTDAYPSEADVLIVTTLDNFPIRAVPNLKHVLYVTNTIWLGSACILQAPEGCKISVVNICEWTKRYVSHNTPPKVRDVLNSPRVSNHTIGNPLLDDVLPDLSAIVKVPRSYAFIAAWERGGDVALRAFRKIRAIEPDAQFHIASYHFDPACSFDEPNVFNHSSLGKKDLMELLARTETLLYPLSLPSGEIHKDTFACVVSESLACGTRVVTHRQGALEELYGEWAEFVDAPPDAHAHIASLVFGERPCDRWCVSEEAVDAFVRAALKQSVRDPIEVAKQSRDRFSRSRLGEMFLKAIPELTEV